MVRHFSVFTRPGWRGRASAAALLALTLLTVAHPARPQAHSFKQNPAIEWSAIVQHAIHNASAPRSAGTSQILHAMVMLAVYDAAMAIGGRHEPYAADIKARHGADLRAAIATAAYRTARARVAPGQYGYLDTQYASYMASIRNGRDKTDGIAVGEQAAAAILALRADDGFDRVVPYECSTVPPAIGEFEPDAGCPSGPGSPQPVDAKVGGIRPFTYNDPSRFRSDGPDPLDARAYADDFNETRLYGRQDSHVRTPKQTDIAYFWSENPYVHWNRNLMNLAWAARLDTHEAARFLAMVHTTAADAVIAGFEAKYYYRAWRPRTAIPLAAYDDNPYTEAEPGWKPLLSVNHPEYPSGHGFWSTAVIEAVAEFFGTRRFAWTLETSKEAVPALQKTRRTYTDLDALMREIGNARIWGGLHWRLAIAHGEQIGGRVSAHVFRHYFRGKRR